MKNRPSMRAGLSMVELIFVITILGIVASIGSEIIAQTYESYIIQRSQYRITTKTELALSQIGNRLRYAIPSSLGFREDKDSAFHKITEGNSGNDKVLQWVSYDGDSFEAIDDDDNRTPGWSGFCDLDASSEDTIVTPASKLGFADTIIQNLGGGGLSDTVIYFPDQSSYDVSGRDGDAKITLDGTADTIWERYKLAWSSYALSIEDGDLYLYYNFDPHIGADLGEHKALILKDITNFRFKGNEGSIRIKICKEEKIGMEENATIHTCKEKVIF